MVQKTSLAAMIVGLLVASSFVGAAAFTSASVDRSANIDVVSDSDGIIGLGAGPSSVVTMTNGELSIDAAVGSALGINTEATMQIGDPADPVTTPAFTVTNNAGNQKNLYFSYALTGTDSDSADDVTFEVYDGTGTQVATFAEGGSASVAAPSGATYYVLVSLDTTNNPTGDDLSGTLTVSAS